MENLVKSNLNSIGRVLDGYEPFYYNVSIEYVISMLKKDEKEWLEVLIQNHYRNHTSFFVRTMVRLLINMYFEMKGND